MIVALAGRRIDAPNSEQPRFPLANIDKVKTFLYKLFKAHHVTCVVSSGACGADLIALEVAGKLGLKRRMVLPFSPEVFRDVSVTDRPGDWGPLFDQITKELAESGDLVILNEQDDNTAFVVTNHKIIDEAIALASQDSIEAGELKNHAMTVIVWNGSSRGEDDVTALFMNESRDRGLPVVEVLTQ